MSDKVVTAEDRANLAGLMGFAEGVLSARSKVQMSMDSGLGVFHESVIADLPGLSLDCDDGSWLRLQRQLKTNPPAPVDHVAQFLDGTAADPSKTPRLKPAISVIVSIEDVSDLVEGGLLVMEDVREVVEDDIEILDQRKVTLHLRNCPEVQKDFEAYLGGAWKQWAEVERPVRKAIALYGDLFDIFTSMRVTEGAPPELIWGVGIGRWRQSAERVDMPLIEQGLDIEVEEDGVIALRPRDLPPALSLKPYIELEVDRSAKIQGELQSLLASLAASEAGFSPFEMSWEPILGSAASNLDSAAIHVDRIAFEAAGNIEAATEQMTFTSTWTIFCRKRSDEARVQDLHALRTRIEDENAQVPPSLRGFAAPAPDHEPQDFSEFGLDSNLLKAAPSVSEWDRGESGSSGMRVSGAGGARKAEAEAGRRVHFFPLPFNEAQGRIADMIDDPALDVVCVSGPPGTGKTHSIANIISHQMAMGKRVLVTARTPEAISAVRGKLPKELQNLVIASVGTDRDSAQQLQDAVSELSTEVVTLSKEEALAEKSRLETLIIEADEIAERADAALSDIARINLTPLAWQGSDRTVIELNDILGQLEDRFGWFTDRPEAHPGAHVSEALSRLQATLPELAADIAYAGANLPRPGELPATGELVKAHGIERAWRDRETPDYSAAPPMARDAAGAEDQARATLAEAEACASTLGALAPETKAIAIALLCADGETGAPRGITRSEVDKLCAEIVGIDQIEAIAKVSFSLGACGFAEFDAAAARGAAGQKPVGFSLFNKPLKEAIASVRLSGRAPENAEEWGVVRAACRLAARRGSLTETMSSFIANSLMSPLPERPWEMASHLKDRQAELASARALVDRLSPVLTSMEGLFPFGVDLAAARATLDLEPLLFALRGNLPDRHLTPEAVTRLQEMAGGSELPILSAMRELAQAIGDADTDPAAIVEARSEITKELERLAKVAPKLEAAGRDLQLLQDAGAAEWAKALCARPEEVEMLVPSDWTEAWAWAEAKARIDRIVALGNGDQHRKAKADAMARRRRHFTQLIRIRTLLGLKKRMTAPVRQAMEAFSQAIGKIGTGKGKKAPRFIRAAKEAAKQASAAAPVWIMPEYKIPEQLPAEFGEFDLVVLDEASQSDITAIAALARGKKILVVGDEEQVSPSVVGISDQKINALRAEHLDGFPNEGLIDENTSIFEITKRMHPDSHVMLIEHFRCVAPIIQFSTRFYNNALVPLRVPKASERFDPPLVDVYIPGAQRQSKTNKDEARWIVDEIARIISDPEHDGRDIGVISLIGAEQSEMIGRMLREDERIGSDMVKTRNIICGDARTMQGQERSIVFLSMVAVPGQAHAQTRKEDRQRINVAMSRAKDRLYLVRSVELEDLKDTDIKAQVLDHFLNPMPEGRVHRASEAESLMDRCDSDFEREVLDLLLKANYRVRPQVAAGGFSIDLVVEGTEDRRLAIELDGDKYHGPAEWDRDMARQAALERAGWVFWRVFGSQWSSQRDLWWQNLRDTLDRMGIEAIGAASVDERFTQTILVDLMEMAQASAQVAEEVAATPAEGLGDAPKAQSNPAAPVTSPGDEDTSQDRAGPEDAAAPSKAGAGAAEHEMGSEGAPEAAVETAVETAFETSISRPGAAPVLPRPIEVSQEVLPLEDDLFAAAAKAIAKSKASSASPAASGHPEAAAGSDAEVGASVGSRLRLEKLSNGSGKLEVTLVKVGHDPDRGRIGIHTPLGESLLGAMRGDKVEYTVGAYVHEVQVLDIQ